MAQTISLSTTSSMSSSEIEIGFEKNSQLSRRNRKNISFKVICHYYGNKGYIRPLCHVRNVKVPNGTMAWIPKCFLGNPQGPISWVPKWPI